ncbi:MAG: POTRA domain-containing protein [Bacteroidota bacterium]
MRKIEITGNKTTKQPIILRELTFNINDTINRANIDDLIDKCKKNLLNTSLFNFVTITYTIDSVFINFIITVKERWYTWPFPLFELSDRNFNTWLQSKNFNRVNYGLYLVQENFRGRKESLKLLVRLGYDEEIGLSYQIPYIGKKQHLGMGISGIYSQNHEIPVSSEKNKQLFFKLYSQRALKEYAINYSLTYRSEIHNTFSVQFSYQEALISDSVYALYPFYLENNKRNRFFSLTTRYRNDYRDFISYPLTGHYFDVEISKKGIGIFKNEINNLYIKSSIRKYSKLFSNVYNSIGIGVKYMPLKTKSFYFQRGLGYGNEFVRGYEYYVIEGQDYIFGKANLSYNLIPTKIGYAKWLPFHKFNTIHYALFSNIFFDAGYSKDIYYKYNNTLNNTLLLGGGIGLDFVTYYDKVIRVEFSYNKLKEKGVFLHFVAPL